MINMSTVVVTGMETHTVFGDSKDAFWDGIVSGKIGIGQGSSEHLHQNEKYLKKTAILTQKISNCIQNALRETYISRDELEKRKAILLFGTFLGEVGCLDNDPSNNARPFDSIANEVAEQLELEMPSIVLSNACASGIQAVGLGMDLIRRGNFDIAIVCGYEALNLFALAGMSSIKSLGDELRPFDANRKGTVLSEGIGVIILESEAIACERKARIFAEVSGCGMSNDANHYVRPHPDGTGIVNAIKMALRDASLMPDDIDYIQAHGTGTLLNDSTETKAIKSVFGDRAYKIPISGIKGSIGHTLGASGIIASIAAILSFEKNMLPPTANYSNFDAACDLDYIPQNSRGKRIERALCHSLGFGGVNGVLALGRYPQNAEAAEDINRQIRIANGVAGSWKEIRSEIELIKMIFTLIKELQIRSGQGQAFFSDMGIIADVGEGLFPSQKQFHEELCNKGPLFVNPSLFCFSFPNRITGEIAREFCITGPTLTICDSGADMQKAYLLGQTLLRRKKAGIALLVKIQKRCIAMLILEEISSLAKTVAEPVDLCMKTLFEKYGQLALEDENAI